jgi:hypothetical protein
MLAVAPSLFLGLGARVLLDKLTGIGEPTIPSLLVFGVWEGVGLSYAYSRQPDLALIAAVGVLGYSAFDYLTVADTGKSLCILLGIALGVLFTELLTQIFDTPPHETIYEEHRTREHRHRPTSHRRTVSFRETDSQTARDLVFHQQITDITSVNSDSDMFRVNQAMSPLEREAAALRTRASLADSERRRYREEKKWAAEQGNNSREEQMRWQEKKYAALMQSFTRQADEIVVEGILMTRLFSFLSKTSF